jgi:xylulokinase
MAKVSDMLILGLDIGTSGCKAIAFDENWNIAAHSHREYDLINAGSNRLDLEAETVWEKLTEAVREINRSIGRGKIGAIAISAIGDVIIPLDDACRTVRPCVIDFDPRGKNEIALFVNDFGTDRLYEITGMPPLHINSLAKILWIKKNEPGIYKKVRRWATFEDYILQKMGVKPAVSFSLAARTMLFDIRKKSWSKDIINAVGLNENQLARPVGSGVVLEKINDKIAKKLGFTDDILACSGGHDMFCAAVGAGLDINDPKTALNIVGTMEAIIVLMKEPKLNKEMLENLYPCFPGFNDYVSLSLNLTSGSILKWYRDLFSDIFINQADKNINVYDRLLQVVDHTKPGDLLLIPHFSGICNPIFNPDSKGTLYGLSLNTGVNDMIQGMIEGLCYDLKMHIQGFQNAGVPINRLRIVGGGSRSDKWLQLKANITGVEIISSTLYEASATGAAALSGCAVGILDDPYKVVKYTKGKEKQFYPSSEAEKLFEEKYIKYRRLNNAVNSYKTN